MRMLKSLGPWLPWIAFLIIAQGSELRLEVGLVVALLLVVALAALSLDRGLLMWVTLGFFAAMTIAVLVFHNAWTVQHFNALANGALAVASWGSLLLGRPFTLDVARQSVDPELWNHPIFLRVNRQITAVWAAAFTVNAAVAVAQVHEVIGDGVASAVSIAVLAAAVAFSSWYPKHVRSQAPTEGESGPPH
ncbi:MAG: hypothetical protein E6Q56_01375 [Mycobacterium sp.]|nr:MAG: hypothetical protein E6Q56_01375 [Mycobacterium sp.]HPZ94394.1 hypothetical protein [Mycobacterium sp.]HQE13968.1 hypothetical protein [Mycobacterium sp.]